MNTILKEFFKILNLRGICSQIKFMSKLVIKTKQKLCKVSRTHVAGAGAIPLRIVTDKRGVISQSLASYELEISKKKFFHLGPCEI